MAPIQQLDILLVVVLLVGATTVACFGAAESGGRPSGPGGFAAALLCLGLGMAATPFVLKIVERRYRTPASSAQAYAPSDEWSFCGWLGLGLILLALAVLVGASGARRP